jgi:predicted pyridoxine 5'-phosphate oxidase superfamily flavin-nucleotide-binding protein
MYHQGSRDLQDRFDTRRLADRLADVTVREELDAGDREFIAGCDMFFLASADAEGRPTCSYKGGDPGFVRVLDPRTIAFPDYDGNGMFRSTGNMLENPHVGLLFIRFDLRRRLRMEGVASIDPEDALAGDYERARFVVRVRADRVFPNCPRYIHEYRLVERSHFVPRAQAEPPIPDWKRRDWARDVLPEGDPARDSAG